MIFGSKYLPSIYFVFCFASVLPLCSSFCNAIRTHCYLTRSVWRASCPPDTWWYYCSLQFSNTDSAILMLFVSRPVSFGQICNKMTFVRKSNEILRPGGADLATQTCWLLTRSVHPDTQLQEYWWQTSICAALPVTATHGLPPDSWSCVLPTISFFWC